MKKIKLSIIEVSKIVSDLGYELISDGYHGLNYPITIKDKNNYTYVTILNRVIRGSLPEFVGKNNPYSINNIMLWCKYNDVRLLLISRDYCGSHEKLKWICLKDDCIEEFDMSWDCISQGQGCPYCAGKRVGKSNCLKIKDPTLASEWNHKKNGILTPNDVTQNSNKKAWWICPYGHEWKTGVNQRSNGRGCPKCNISKGEKRIEKWLKENRISYVGQKKFSGLLGLGGRSLSFDFYLPEHNLLIEYQGEFHDHSVRYEMSELEKTRRIEHDLRKREYATNNNTELLQIWYWEYEQIEKILEKHLRIS